MKKIMALIFASQCIVAPLLAGGEIEEPFSLEKFVKKNAAHKRAYEKKQRVCFQEKVTLQKKNNKTTEAIVKNFHVKYGHEMAELLQKHTNITQKMNSSHTEEEIALFLAKISSQNCSQTKRPAKTKKEDPIFILIPQPENVPDRYNPAQPDDLRFLYCLNEVCLAGRPQ